jgi:acyl-CoA synthetase (AMP-forming)/AMP-acid ligase II
MLSRVGPAPVRPRSPAELFESCGFPIACCEVRILDDDDREVPAGTAGEICGRAPHVMAEYWRRPEQTAETLKNGWLHTGGIARADERGYILRGDILNPPLMIMSCLPSRMNTVGAFGRKGASPTQNAVSRSEADNAARSGAARTILRRASSVQAYATRVPSACYILSSNRSVFMRVG